MDKLVSGLHCEPDTVKDEMQATKELWEKTGGRTVREPRSQQPEGDSDFHLSHQLGCGDRDRADDRRKHRTGFRGIQLRLHVRGVTDNFFDTVLFIESRSSFQPEQIEIRWLA